MDFTTILFLSLAAIFALGFAFFQYLYKAKAGQIKYIFFGLRTASVFVLLLLLINPEISTTTYETQKANLILLADNSESIFQLEQEEELSSLIDSLNADSKLQERFELSTLAFGENLQFEDSLDFSAKQTNINAALNQIKSLFSTEPSAVILLSDGNQTLGRDYRYFSAAQNQQLFPVILGDTTQYPDLFIDRLNVNRYAFLNNKFPVEAFINYTGEESVITRFEIKTGENTVYAENIELDAENTSVVVQAELPANRLGVLSYSAKVVPLENEKNKENNTQNFAIEVVDERTNVLILSEIAHPDLGAIKKSIEKNEQRKADIRYLGDDFQIQEYQLIVFYQPTRAFETYMKTASDKKTGVLFITGTQTEWRFLNENQQFFSKDYSHQNQEIFGSFNKNFTRFQIEDIGFENFPPLEDKFGEVRVKGLDALLFQQIENTGTNQPLLAISEENLKTGVLFGENIWRWRATNFQQEGSFESFDDFFGKIIQNLASQTRRERLSLDYESFYYGNEQLRINAQYFDENYRFDSGGNLEITLRNSETENITEATMLLRNNSFVFELDNLEEGTYQFEVKEQRSGITKSGKFRLIPSNIEVQFLSANLQKMEALAAHNQTSVYFSSNLQSLISDLVNDDKLKPLQKSHENTVPLIDWVYLLAILIVLFAIEWFLRKYKGLI